MVKWANKVIVNGAGILEIWCQGVMEIVAIFYLFNNKNTIFLVVG